jgi:hypothetical protein
MIRQSRRRDALLIMCLLCPSLSSFFVARRMRFSLSLSLSSSLSLSLTRVVFLFRETPF